MINYSRRKKKGENVLLIMHTIASNINATNDQSVWLKVSQVMCLLLPLQDLLRSLR